MGGKTSTSTQSVSIPPEVLARYRSVNARAEQVAETPFQSYSYDPSAFVAPLTPTQIAGIQNVNASQGMGYPFYQAGTQMTAAGAAPVGPITGTDIARYYNPFTAAVAAPTYEALRQQQAQEMQGATANAIRSGAFGGDRAGLVAANLARQQQLGTSQAMAPIFQQGYSQAQEAAQRQQQVDLQNQARMLQAGQQMAGLGTGVQQLGIGGGQAQLAAGMAEQQTQQAGLQALYNQFLQQVGYPFQVAQFLANIAMGTGALSGSTTTTTQPAPFFSDRREKTNVKKLGKGLYAFDYKDDVEAAEREGKPMPPKRVGPMAQEIEKDKPGMVIDVNDYKVVDPGREKAAYGGLMSFMNSLPQDLQQQSMGGGVTPEMAGQGFARGGDAVGGGMISDVEFRQLLAQQAQALGIYGANTTLGQGAPGGKGLFDPGRVQAPTRLATASSAPRQQPSRMAELSQGLGQLTGKQGLGQSLEAIYDAGKRGLVGSPGRAATANAPAIEPSKGLIGSGGQFNRSGYLSSTGSDTANQPAAGATKPADASYKASIDEMPQGSQPLTGLGGLAQGDLPEMTDVMELAYGGVARHGYATDGSVNEPDDDSPISAYRTPGPGLQIPDELKSKYEMLKPEKPPQQQSSGLGEVLGLAKMGAKIAMGMPPIFANGGVVPRSGYQSGGEPEPDPTLIQTESGGNFQAENQAVGSGGLRGHFGRLQFGQARLQDAIRAGVLPEGTTPQQFKASPDLQKETEKWHFKDIGNFIQQRGLDQSIGSEIAGIPVTQQGLINVAHLGGKGGLQKFIETGGRYNPEDENRTRLSDYLAMGAKNKGVVPNVPQEGAQTASKEGTTGETYNLARPPQRGVAAGIAPPKSLEGKEQSWGDFLTSRQFVVPFLSGLGAMASSPSRYLGTAVLQGLGAGAQAFGEQEAKAEERRFRGREVTVKEREANIQEIAKKMDLLRLLRETAAGYSSFGKPVPPEIQAQIDNLVADITKLGGNAGQQPTSTAPAPAPTPTTTAPQPQKPAETGKPETEGKPAETAPTGPAPQAPPEPNIMDPKFLGKLDPDYNPAILQRRARETARFSTAEADKLRNRADELRKRILEKGEGIGPNGEIVELPGFKEKKQYEANLSKVEEFFNKQANQAEAREKSLMQLRTLSEIISKYKTGAGAKFEADAIRALRTVLPSVVPSDWESRPAEYQRFVKDAMAQVFEEVKTIGGQLRVAELTGLQLRNPAPDLDPAANKKIIAEQIAAIRFVDKLNEDAQAAREQMGYKFDLNKFITNWRKKPENDPKKMAAAAELDISARGDVPRKGGRIDPSKIVIGQSYTLEPEDLRDPQLGYRSAGAITEPMVVKFALEKDPTNPSKQRIVPRRVQ